ncbi:cAMP-activated global transcriptional regulator CRP [Usitatibacter rugosus]|uniref:cAMP-activated global transcriptional regulator CRP n=1 Tax=Usitatibacter rugosus TaxID=2732067 RepID=A0A6M4GQK8_9PROT|nr:Crp/Fnr family transcriptional regulator [Usitatibacter rugosus]QJR09078.1 cAMP-activated global transcriptional regulator CRP [Usitatibacter rugosus]
MNDRVKADASLVLSPEELAEITRHAVARTFRPRTVLVSEGENTDALYIIVEGKARAYVGDASGREVVLSIMGPGEYFGEIAFDEGPRSASVITLETCKMLVVPRAEFAEFIKTNPAFAMSFIRKLIHQVRVLTENVRSLALMDAYGRVARLLLDSAVTNDGVQYIPERLTQAEIASRVGCSREMVSRIFKDLVQGNYISVETDRIVIHRKPPARW